MIVQLGSYGATSPVTQGDCPAGGNESSWCDCMWPAPDPLNSKCKSTPIGMLTPKPWTIVGAQLRGIPHTATGLPSLLPIGTGVGTTGGSGGAPASSSSDLFGIPRTILLVGGGVLALGVLTAIVMKRRSASYAGARRSRRSRRRR